MNTARPRLFLLLLFALVLAVSAPSAWVQEKKDDDGQAEPEICRKISGCHKTHDKKLEKIQCPVCERKKIPSEDAACSTCASKGRFCRHCGLPRTKGGTGRGGGTLKSAFALIDPKEMRKVLFTLASDEFEGRQTGSEGIKKARAFIISNLKNWGCRPIKDSYELPWGSCANIGVIFPGSDPKLKNEYVVVGSHYDHIGLSRGGGGGDNINNGADDNASGSTTNMFIAKALAKTKLRTKRGIICLWFSGEETGLNGSRAYCNSPAIPMSQTVAMLNCDMLGRNPGKPAELMGVGSSPEFLPACGKATKMVPQANVKVIEGKGQYFNRSDQANFWDKGVPVMFIFAGMHADYHRPSDHAEKIAYDRMALLGRYMLTILVELANHQGKIAVNPDYK